MNQSQLLTFCMNKPGVTQSAHRDWAATQIKLADVMFAMLHEVDGRPALSLKTSPALAELLRQSHEDVFPSALLNKAHWSTLWLDGSLPDSQIYYLVEDARQQALELLPASLKQQYSR
ncbi:MmcQ/YjbR family DNA-binding protein [Mangrovibacter yixingensis]|uniref:MmcQ/YjbR family DNA-binding protein n=1 Tax=Mangrovibacter yixingensis TaxID=1529639 RepID=UPI001CFDCDF2|nr:MmcQ/YjbR family DNA-binding protein [Mangrovibacter yixingensis]